MSNFNTNCKRLYKQANDKKMGLSLCNLKLQKWCLYCYLCEIHTEIDAVYGITNGTVAKSDFADSIREENSDRNKDWLEKSLGIFKH